jgi:hypothetical protein
MVVIVWPTAAGCVKVQGLLGLGFHLVSEQHAISSTGNLF